MTAQKTRWLDGVRWALFGLLPADLRASHRAITWLLDEPVFASPPVSGKVGPSSAA